MKREAAFLLPFLLSRPIPGKGSVEPWPWLVWLSGLSAGLQTKGSLVRFPVRTHAWVAGQVLSCRNSNGLVTTLISGNREGAI